MLTLYTHTHETINTLDIYLLMRLAYTSQIVIYLLWTDGGKAAPKRKHTYASRLTFTS